MAATATVFGAGANSCQARYSQIPGISFRKNASAVTTSLKSSSGNQFAHRMCRSSAGHQLKCTFPLVTCAASSANSGDENLEDDPYAVLGVNPLRGFEAAMTAHRKKKKEAERSGDKAALERLDAAYNKIMMRQFQLRKQGMGTGSFQVSKDIRFADEVPILPWLPRKTRTTTTDILINLAISSVFVVMNIVKGYSEYRPLQFLIFASVIRLFFKLKSFASDAPRSEFEDEDGSSARDQQNGKIMLRAVALVFGVVTFASMAHYLAVKGFVHILGIYPEFLSTGQEIITTVLSAVLLFIISTWYR